MNHPFASLRPEFPILETKTYLASHSLGAVPRATEQALTEYYTHWAEQGIGAWDGAWWEAIEAFSSSIEKILGAPAGSVAPMQNATRGMAGVASCFDWSGKRNGIVLTELEFTTSYPLWQGLEALGAQVTVVPSKDGVTVETEALIAAIDATTRLVPTSHVYFRSGAIQDLAAVAQAAHEVGAYVLGDGYQAVGTVPVDVRALDLDFYVGGSHKWLCGGPGAGFLYVRPEVVRGLRPRLTGWFGLEDPFAYDVDTEAGAPAKGARRFLGGTPNVPGLYAAREGIAIVQEVGIEAIRAYTRELSQLAVEEAIARGYPVTSPTDPDQRTAMVCMQVEGGAEKVQQLAEQGIVVDHRPDAGVRLSPHFYNTEDDVLGFFEALDGL